MLGIGEKHVRALRIQRPTQPRRIATVRRPAVVRPAGGDLPPRPAHRLGVEFAEALGLPEERSRATAYRAICNEVLLRQSARVPRRFNATCGAVASPSVSAAPSAARRVASSG